MRSLPMLYVPTMTSNRPRLVFSVAADWVGASGFTASWSADSLRTNFTMPAPARALFVRSQSSESSTLSLLRLTHMSAQALMTSSWRGKAYLGVRYVVSR